MYINYIIHNKFIKISFIFYATTHPNGVES